MAASPLLPPAPAAAARDYGALKPNPKPTATPDAKPSPSSSSFLARCFFTQATPLMRLAHRRQLASSDIPPLLPADTALFSSRAFRRAYLHSPTSIFRAVVRTYATAFVRCGLMALFSAACGVLAPAVLHHVIDAFAAPALDVPDLALWLGAFGLAKLANAVVASQMNLGLSVVALRLTAALKMLLFEKALRRGVASGESDTAAVDLTNAFTSDVDSVLWAALLLNNAWLIPLQIAVVTLLLYYVLDAAALVGLGVILLSMALNLALSAWMGDAYRSVMRWKDTRMKVVKEAFGAIQIVKLNAWEGKMGDKMAALRRIELGEIARYMYLCSTSLFVLWATPLFVSMASFAVYVLVLHRALTAAKVFTAMALFNALRDPLRDLPMVISQCIQAKVALDRMSAFLALEEATVGAVHRSLDAPDDDVAIAVDDACFAWPKDFYSSDGKDVKDHEEVQVRILQHVQLTIKTGDFVVVHGPVGAGKSSLCAALLGEMPCRSGSVTVRGRVAYYAQQPWLQHQTIRDNILFGEPFDVTRYYEVLDVCGLERDLVSFPAGDETELGPKGVNLSGGQKARICLARACYANADVLLLDSPLAAVDAIVQREIFAKCMCEFLAQKTIVLVTHSPEIISSKATNYKVEIIDGHVIGERMDPVFPRQPYTQALPSSGSALPPRSQRSQALSMNRSAAVISSGRIVLDEEREQGRVSSRVFCQYFNALGGFWTCAVLLVLQALWQAFQVASDVWLSHWTGQSPRDDKSEWIAESAAANLGVYVLLGSGSALMVLFRSLAVSFIGLRASRYLFESMTRSLLDAPMRFFEANPLGRIVNRYSDDIGTVDFLLPYVFGTLLAVAFFTVFQLATAIAVIQTLGLLVIPLVWAYIEVARFYITPSREISRIWKVSTSPVLSHVTSSEEGVVVIRSFGVRYVERAVQTLRDLMDANNAVWMCEAITNQWFQVRMQLLGAGVVMVVVSALVYLHAYLSPGLVGLAFSYALSVDGALAGIVRAWSSVEITMVSPERLLEYANVPAESAKQCLVIEPSAEWPRHGTIYFERVTFSYRPGSEQVLREVSFSIRDHEKIGIVGRTGAGKSSLVMALFRINDLVRGRILIDGQDISVLPIRTLRSRMSIIPQSPVLFRGTIRAYMDPFDEYTDASIWDALGKVGLKMQIAALKGQLLSDLRENGENFSVGERQMLCLARAMLTQARIVIMDEATASIDQATERRLQQTIRQNFEAATVLTIAHRLATVLDCERIMVVDDGLVVEFDTPQKLVREDTSMFYELAKQGGCVDRLLAMAE